MQLGELNALSAPPRVTGWKIFCQPLTKEQDPDIIYWIPTFNLEVTWACKGAESTFLQLYLLNYITLSAIHIGTRNPYKRRDEFSGLTDCSEWSFINDTALFQIWGVCVCVLTHSVVSDSSLWLGCLTWKVSLPISHFYFCLSAPHWDWTVCAVVGYHPVGDLLSLFLLSAFLAFSYVELIRIFFYKNSGSGSVSPSVVSDSSWANGR